MDTKIVEQWMAYGTDAAQPMVRLNEVTAKALERLGHKQIDVARDCLDVGARQMQLLGKSKDPQGFLMDEQRLFAELGEKMIVHTQDFIRIATENHQSVVDWAQEGLRQATTQTKSAAEKKAA
jgi:hypothetical protein